MICSNHPKTRKKLHWLVKTIMKSFGNSNSEFPVVFEPLTHLMLCRQCIIPPQGVASSYIFIYNGRSKMAEKAKNYTVGVPAAWQQQQDNWRSRGAPAEAKFGAGAVHSAAQGGEWTARRPAGAHSLWAGFTGSGEPTGGPRSWQASSSSSIDFKNTFKHALTFGT